MSNICRKNIFMLVSSHTIFILLGIKNSIIFLIIIIIKYIRSNDKAFHFQSNNNIQLESTKM